MTFSRLILSTASIGAAVACAPAFAQQHEVGHWFGAPADPSAATQAFFASGVLTVTGNVSGDDAKSLNGFVSRFPAGGRADALPTTPLDDPGLQTRNARQEAKENKYYDITLKNANVAAAGGRDLTLKGQNILQNAQEIRPMAKAGSSDSTIWVRTAQPHTTSSVMPTQLGWGVWEVQVGSAPKTALPAAGVRPGPMPGGHGAPIRR
jgi:hypothetical protein